MIPFHHYAILQNGATTGAGTAVDLKGSVQETVVYIVWSAGVVSGEVKIETAHDATYGGTWGAMATLPSQANRVSVVNISGALAVVRARISVDIGGGTVTAVLCAN